MLSPLKPPMARMFSLAALLVVGCNGPSDVVNDHLRRGDLALSQEQYAKALSAYGHAHDLAPTDARVQRAQMRGRVYLMANQPTHVAPEALDDVLYEATTLRELEPNIESVCLTAWGNVLARRGDITGAKAKFQEAIKAEEQSPLPHIALGMVSLNEPGGLASAKIEFELALQRKPDAANALVGLGQVKLAEGDVAGAIDKLEAAGQRQDDFQVHLALGTARLRVGKHADAAKALRRALAFDPKNPDAQSALGQALLALGQLEEAEGMLSAAMQSRPDTATAIALGFTLIKLGQAERALALFGPILAKDPLSAPALFGAALANEKLGRIPEALVLYRRVLSLPAEGPQKGAVLDLQKDARNRIAALTPEPAANSSASTPPLTPTPIAIPQPTPPPALPTPPGRDPLNGRD